MKTLKESILGNVGLSTIENIKTFILENYNFFLPDDDNLIHDTKYIWSHIEFGGKEGKYILNTSNLDVISNIYGASQDGALTNGDFEWGRIRNGSFYVRSNSSLKGSPKKVDNLLNIDTKANKVFRTNRNKDFEIKSLKGCPQEVGEFYLYIHNNCDINDIPKIIHGDCYIYFIGLSNISNSFLDDVEKMIKKKSKVGGQIFVG